MIPEVLGAARLVQRAGNREDGQRLAAFLRGYLAQHPADAAAMIDLATVLHTAGEREEALALQRRALERHTCYRVAAAHGPGLRVLALVTIGDLGAFTPLTFLLGGTDVQLDLLYLTDDHPPPAVLPDHDLVFNALGDRRDTRASLAAIAARTWPRPLLNAPAAVRRSGREQAWRHLADVPGLVAPPVATAPRAALAVDAFPVIIRPVDGHGGRSLARLDGPADLAAYLAREPAEAFTLSPYHEYRSPDGQYRKYRVAFIGGRPYPVHMALSERWMVHYAGMAESEPRRAEEARFLAEFETGFGRRHAGALAGLAARIGLDYMVADLGEAPDGRLLFFEVDPTAIVHALDPPAIFPYKAAPTQALFAAFRSLLAGGLRA